MTFLDAHTHLNADELFPDWKEHLQSFIAIGGTGLITVGVDHERNKRGLLIAEEAKTLFGDQCLVKATLGGHPSLVSFGAICSEEQIQIYIQQLEADLKSQRNNVVAIGECGLDAHYTGWGKEHLLLQQSFFAAQLSLATQYGLPVVIHSRDAFAETREVLQEFYGLPMYMHCWGYGVDELEKLLTFIPTLRIGFCGNLSYPKATALRESLDFLVGHEAFLDNRCGLLLETDAPWLSVQSKRGQMNMPSYIPVLYNFVAQHLGWTNEQLTQRVRRDFTRLFDYKGV